MTAVTFVNDPAFDRTLGEQLAQEIRDATQPGGDCRACGNPLGTGPVRLDAQGDEAMRLIYPRHAACQPAPDVEGLLVARGENTYLVNATLNTMNQSSPAPTGWRRLFRRSEPVLIPAVIILINPSIDGFFISTGQKSLIDQYLNRDEFSRPNEVSIGGTAPQGDLSLDVGPTHVTVVDAMGGRYEINDAPALATTVGQLGGALVAMTFQHHASEIETDPAALRRIMTDLDHTAIAWVPTTPDAQED